MRVDALGSIKYNMITRYNASIIVGMLLGKNVTATIMVIRSSGDSGGVRVPTEIHIIL